MKVCMIQMHHCDKGGVHTNWQADPVDFRQAKRKRKKINDSNLNMSSPLNIQTATLSKDM